MADNKTLNSKTRMRNSAPKPPGSNEQKRGAYYCCKCGKKFLKQQTYFPVSRSPLFKGNNGYLPICKECFEELYDHYCDVLKDEVAAIERVCQKFDIYFSMPMVESSLADSTDRAVIMTYISRMGLPQFKNKSYDTTIDEDEYAAAIAERNREPRMKRSLLSALKSAAGSSGVWT